MGKKKDVITVAEAKNQLLQTASDINLKQVLTNNLGIAMLACFVAGAIFADNGKAKEGLIDIMLTYIKKLINH